MSNNHNVTSVKGEEYLKGIAIDIVIFGFNENQLKVLLLEYKSTGLLGLPAGYILKNENLNDAARRVVSERTSLKDIFIEQFYVFGDTSRHDTKPIKKILSAEGASTQPDHWLLDRFISVGYFALVDFKKVIPQPDQISNNCQWYDLSDLPNIMLDHNLIIKKALETLQTNLDSKLIGFNLLAETFTMAELQSVYETILNKKLQRTAFQRKMLSLAILERVAKRMTGGAHKAPYLYRFIKNETL
ncbi:NUDIX hydrolase [Albibacterium bauzanense]|uniref:ADP-ribose pyrophosphatase YjhB (NUDIX family) n=1 Tax=Albibacterium bauzanense TaxID=653929 RepID=A0A4R1LUT8_9SPHI|nr:NUDIX domain-containing protein [Albibacterium bauzanense]TCK83126.1 ADP-ribose pyrophosphatase YjhB (NUDIX family) [Albibacterium bauzanense]